jgi:hypothetical protein
VDRILNLKVDKIELGIESWNVVFEQRGVRADIIRSDEDVTAQALTALSLSRDLFDIIASED